MSITVQKKKLSLRPLLYAAGAFAVMIGNTSCCSIFNGSSQDVGISSNPAGATVTINGAYKGVTPLALDLKRSDNHLVTIEKEGYETFSQTLTKSTSGWVWGNIVFGGLIGLGVDAITGSINKLEPEQINAQMTPKK